MQVALPELGALLPLPVTRVLRAPVLLPVLPVPQAPAAPAAPRALVVLVVLEGNIFFLDLCGLLLFVTLSIDHTRKQASTYVCVYDKHLAITAHMCVCLR